MQTKLMVGAKEAAKLFSIAPGTLANWRSAKRGPKFYKAKRKVLYKLSELEDFFTANPVLTIDSVSGDLGLAGT